MYCQVIDVIVKMNNKSYCILTYTLKKLMIKASVRCNFEMLVHNLYSFVPGFQNISKHFKTCRACVATELTATEKIGD